ncbi:hypothetical protein D9M69_584990 [compost metagenome]
MATWCYSPMLAVWRSTVCLTNPNEPNFSVPDYGSVRYGARIVRVLTVSVPAWSSDSMSLSVVINISVASMPA